MTGHISSPAEGCVSKEFLLTGPARIRAMELVHTVATATDGLNVSGIHTTSEIVTQVGQGEEMECW